MNEPWNIYIEQINNILYIADSVNHRIQRWFLNGSNGATVAGVTNSAGSSSTQLNKPRDVYVDSSQNLYVADSLNGRIQYFSNGNLNGVTVSSSWTNIGELWGVQFFNGFIYANDNTKSAVWRNGTTVAGNQGTGSAANQLNLPQGFSVDTSILPGTLYIVNSQQHTIVQWLVGASNGTIVAGLNGIQGSNASLLKFPVSMKLDSDGNMFIVDNNNHRIQLYCRNSTSNRIGRTIVGTGVPGNTAQTLNYPAGIALDSALNLYVSDTSNHRIQRFRRLIWLLDLFLFIKIKISLCHFYHWDEIQ